MIIENDSIIQRSSLVWTFILLGVTICFLMLISNIFFHEIIFDQAAAALLLLGNAVFLVVLAVAARRYSTHTPQHDDIDKYHQRFLFFLFANYIFAGISVGYFLSHLFWSLLFGVPPLPYSDLLLECTNIIVNVSMILQVSKWVGNDQSSSKEEEP
jgi:vacuolar-type H+-ATPase subunit I/STV1